MSDEKSDEKLEDSAEDLLEKVRAQRALSKSGVEAMKKTRFAQQQSVQARTLRTQAVLDQLRAEEEEKEEAERAKRPLPETAFFDPDKL